MADIRNDQGSEGDDEFQELRGSSPPGLAIVDVGSLADLATAGVAPDQIRFVRETLWAVAGPAPPLATTGAGTCLVVVVHHRGARRGGLAHISTSNTSSQQELYESARDTIAELLTFCVAGEPDPVFVDPPVDVVLGAGRDFFPGKVLSTERGALASDHLDLPDWLNDQLDLRFSFAIIDRRQQPGRPLPPTSGRLPDTGYVVYDGAGDRLFVLDRRSNELVWAVQKYGFTDDVPGRNETWGKHPGA